jgi:hypothetical protein
MKNLKKKISLKKTTLLLLTEETGKMGYGGKNYEPTNYGGDSLCYCPFPTKTYTVCRCL